MYYGNKSVKELDTYYGINTDKIEYPYWQQTDCEKIQQAFNNHAIMLTLAECKELYETYSDETHCASWENGIEDWDEGYIFKLLLPWLKDIMQDKAHRILKITDELGNNGYWVQNHEIF